MKKLTQWIADMLGLYTEHDIGVNDFLAIENERKAWDGGYEAGIAYAKRNGWKKPRSKAGTPFKPSKHEQTK